MATHRAAQSALSSAFMVNVLKAGWVIKLTRYAPNRFEMDSKWIGLAS
jgi:hypothetical protein